MTYAQAREIGVECGLEHPAEFYNNVRLHAMNLFSYAEIQEELDELRETAETEGLRFSSVCGDAILDGESTDELCYMCQRFQAL